MSHRPSSLVRLLALSLAAFSLATPVMVQAQAVDGYKFLDAVKKRDGDAVTTMLNIPGNIINTRDASNGRTAIHIVTERRDLNWMNFILGKGGRVDAEDNQGITPLLIATQLRYADGINLLLDKGANVNKGDGQGVTPLIRAVLNRDLPTVRLLVARGANADQSDSVTGLSARDQAKRDPRAAMILQALSAPKAAPARPVMGPSIK